MSLALTIGCSVLGVLLLPFALRQLTRGLRAGGRAAFARRYPPADVLRAETLAPSFGQHFQGVW